MRRFAFAAEISAILYLISAGVGIWAFTQTSARLPSGSSPIGVVAIPAVAAVLQILLCVLVPSLVPQARIVPPLNVTMPVLFAALLLLVDRLLFRQDVPIMVNKALAVAFLWQAPVLHVVSFGLQLVVLSAIALRKPAAPKPS